MTGRFLLAGLLCFDAGCADNAKAPLAPQDANGQAVKQQAPPGADPMRAPAAPPLAPPGEPGPLEPRGESDLRPAAAESQNPLIRGLRQMLGDDQLIEEKGELDQSLAEADDLLTQVKQQNREAIRNVNRQVRIGGGSAPHVVLITVPELSPGDLGCYGQTHYQTPRIDELAAGGTRFTTCYAGSPQTELSWWCLMTGQDLGRYRARLTSRNIEESPRLLPQDATIAEMLWQAGYTTAFVGAWGMDALAENDLPRSHGYDEFFGFLTAEAGRQPFPEILWSNASRIRLPANADGKRQQFSLPLLLDELEVKLQRPRSGGRPLFLQVNLPWPDTRVALPESMLGLDDGYSPADRQHAAAVQLLDAAVGRILDTLTEHQLRTRTVILLTALRGRPLDAAGAESRLESHGPYRTHSGALSEAALRVPFILAGAPQGRNRAAIRDEPCGLWDVLPTLADLTSALQRPRSLSGVSLLPGLQGEEQTVPRLLYWEDGWEDGGGPRTQAVRLGDWKGIRQAGVTELGGIELFHLRDDPAESTNVAADHPEIIRKMLAPAAAPRPPAGVN